MIKEEMLKIFKEISKEFKEAKFIPILIEDYELLLLEAKAAWNIDYDEIERIEAFYKEVYKELKNEK